jgi:hypothetical protein
MENARDPLSFAALRRLDKFPALVMLTTAERSCLVSGYERVVTAVLR